MQRGIAAVPRTGRSTPDSETRFTCLATAVWTMEIGGRHAAGRRADDEPLVVQRATIVDQAITPRSEAARVSDIERAVQRQVARHVEQRSIARRAERYCDYRAVCPERVRPSASVRP